MNELKLISENIENYIYRKENSNEYYLKSKKYDFVEKLGLRKEGERLYKDGEVVYNLVFGEKSKKYFCREYISLKLIREDLERDGFYEIKERRGSFEIKKKKSSNNNIIKKINLKDYMNEEEKNNINNLVERKNNIKYMIDCMNDNIMRLRKDKEKIDCEIDDIYKIVENRYDEEEKIKNIKSVDDIQKIINLCKKKGIDISSLKF